MDLIKPFIEHILYPAMEKKKGNRIRTYLEELKQSQSRSREELMREQEEKLGSLLLFSIHNVEAYKGLSGDGALEELIRRDPRAALLRFPVLPKQVFKADPDRYLADGADRASLIPNTTGGSSGEPTHFYIDRVTVEHFEAARWRGLSWSGITPGSRSVMIWGNPFELSKAEEKSYYRKEKYLKNRIMIPAYGLKPQAMAEYIKTIEDYRPEYFYGYASALAVFARLMLEQGRRLSFTPKAVVSTSESLFPFQRELIGKAFGCAVINEYGARDGGILAYECPCGRLHITCENALVEVVDQKTLEPAPAGQPGLILVTDLNNYSMPRLRYALGDTVTLSDETCPCGMELPVMNSVEGREDDTFVTTEGGFVHGVAFNNIIKRSLGVTKFQIVQFAPDRAELSLVTGEGGEPEGFAGIMEDIRALLPGTEISVKYVEDIPVTASGKYRYAIRKFEL
ncbi:phenylacetate--CoA ligase family protein [Bacilliculturomica massiliensis]|uniref:phenylacetate--CoA ligase family protein n=1 Tax=Bacilliculturomica massiliensis TaxID=1917867 RepID=UPI001031F3D6|nr:phenylacetate--CoA ligase family protein [Bacilliculturomica massiliensis]